MFDALDPTQHRIAQLRERAREMIHAGAVIRGLNHLARVNAIALKRAQRRQGCGL